MDAVFEEDMPDKVARSTMDKSEVKGVKDEEAMLSKEDVSGVGKRPRDDSQRNLKETTRTKVDTESQAIISPTPDEMYSIRHEYETMHPTEPEPEPEPEQEPEPARDVSVVRRSKVKHRKSSRSQRLSSKGKPPKRQDPEQFGNLLIVPVDDASYVKAWSKDDLDDTKEVTEDALAKEDLEDVTEVAEKAWTKDDLEDTQEPAEDVLAKEDLEDLEDMNEFTDDALIHDQVEEEDAEAAPATQSAGREEEMMLIRQILQHGAGEGDSPSEEDELGTKKADDASAEPTKTKAKAKAKTQAKAKAKAKMRQHVRVEPAQGEKGEDQRHARHKASVAGRRRSDKEKDKAGTDDALKDRQKHGSKLAKGREEGKPRRRMALPVAEIDLLPTDIDAYRDVLRRKKDARSFDSSQFERTNAVIVEGIRLFLRREGVDDDVQRHLLAMVGDRDLSNGDVIGMLSRQEDLHNNTKQSLKVIVAMTKDAQKEIAKEEGKDKEGEEPQKRCRTPPPFLVKFEGQRVAAWFAYVGKKTAGLLEEVKATRITEAPVLLGTEATVDKLIQYHSRVDKNTKRMTLKSEHCSLWTKMQRERGGGGEGGGGEGERGRLGGEGILGGSEQQEGESGDAIMGPNSISDKEDCKAYLARHKIFDLFKLMTARILHQLPGDPLTYLISMTHEMTRHHNSDLEYRESRKEDIKSKYT